MIDPRKTDSASFADLHLQLTPGTDVVLYNAIGRCLYKSGLIDEDFIKEHTEGFDAYRKVIFETSLKEASKICGVPIKEIQKAAAMIGLSEGFISMWAMGLNQSVIGTDKNTSLLNLSLITGQVGKPGAGPFL